MPRFFLSLEDWPVIVDNDEDVHRAPAGTWEDGEGIDALFEIGEAQFRAKFPNLPELDGVYIKQATGGGLYLARWWTEVRIPPAPASLDGELDLTVFEPGPAEIPGPIVLTNFDGQFLTNDAGALLTQE